MGNTHHFFTYSNASNSGVALKCRENEERPAPLAATPADFDPALAESWPLRILVADDYDLNQKLVARIMQGFGYGCEVAANGLEVIQALERQSFDLVFLDVQMPEIDGYETAREIRKRWSDPERPWLVAMTVNALRGDREKCLEAGVDDFIAKPVQIRRDSEGLGESREAEACLRIPAIREWNLQFLKTKHRKFPSIGRGSS